MSIRKTNKTKPGGLDGTERINIESRKGINSDEFNLFDTSLQEIADLGGGSDYTFAEGLTDTAGIVTLEGPLGEKTAVILLDHENSSFGIKTSLSDIGKGGFGFQIGQEGFETAFEETSVSSSYFTQTTSNTYFVLEDLATGALGSLDLNKSGGGLMLELQIRDASNNRFEITLQSESGDDGCIINDTMNSGGLKYANDYSNDFTTRSLPDVSYVHSPELKSGVDQAAAGAVIGELWVDTANANVVKMGV